MLVSPVVIHFLLEGDDVALLEAELPGVLRLEVVQSLAGGLGQLGGRGAGRVPAELLVSWVQLPLASSHLAGEATPELKPELNCEAPCVGVPAGEAPGLVEMRVPLCMLLQHGHRQYEVTNIASRGHLLCGGGG